MIYCTNNGCHCSRTTTPLSSHLCYKWEQFKCLVCFAHLLELLGNLTEACHLLKSTSNICTSTQSHLEFNVFIGQTKICLRTGLNSMKEIGKPLTAPFSFTCNLISLMMETEGAKESNSNLRCTWHS